LEALVSSPNIPPGVLAPLRIGKRHTQRQIKARRLRVWEMLNCGQAIDDIAKSERVSAKTIERDLDWWEERLGFTTEQLKADPKKAAIDVGMTAAKLQKIGEDAYVEYAAAQNGAFKARFLQTSAQAYVLRHKVLADAGYLPKVGHDQAVATTVKISFESRFGKDAPEAVFDDPKSRRKVLEAAFKVLNTGLLSDSGTMGEAMHPVSAEIPLEDPNEV
jgi:hypothetical protein